MKKVAIVHYDEIALKGKNRNFFECALVDNIQNKLNVGTSGVSTPQVRNSWGRIFVKNVTEDNTDFILQALSSTPGVATFGIGVELQNTQGSSLDISEIGNAAIEILNKEQFETFRITVKRVDKTIEKTSNEIEREVGEVVFEHFEKEKNVKLKNPDAEVVVEILRNSVIVYKKRKGMGGLPVGTSGRAVALLSGGFDSPVAAFELIKRGVRPVFAHFHGLPKTSPKSVEKVREIARVLTRYAGSSELVLVPIVPAMKEIARNAPEKLRVILLRRLMMRMSERIADRRGAKAIITGESVGQVASQTLENLGAVADATNLPVLRPLCGLNKVEIIQLSRRIGTHDISARPHDDTCSMFVPDKPETKAKMGEVFSAEETYDVGRLVDNAIEDVEEERLRV